MTGVDHVDFEAILRDARRNHQCAECGVDRDYRQHPRSLFCSDKCRYKFRWRRRYAADPEGERAKSRDYYWANRERVLEKAAARRGVSRPAERSACAECEGLLEGRQRVVCSSRCRDRRYARLHPEAMAEKQRRKRARRRARLAEGGS